MISLDLAYAIPVERKEQWQGKVWYFASKITSELLKYK